VAFKDRLQLVAPVAVLMWDERFTSRLADNLQSRTNGQDAVAACYMLQSYLDSHAHLTEDC
jgi:RNase H-fold protein (predicted Holliday junction resolvase)